MQRLLVGAVLVVVIAAAVVGAYAWFGPSGGRSTGAPSPANAAGAVLDDPMGTSTDPKDPGEIHYRHGRYPEAIAYWTEEAAKGNAQAAHRLGVEYMDGKPGVVERDSEKAMKYHRQAALAGNALSMFDVGTLFEYGMGISKDIAQAARWYGHSARYGLAQGQYNFATMLEAGEGITKDEIEAYKFFILAARGGFTGVPYDDEKLLIDKNAPTPTELMQRRLTTAQLNEGRARADSFQPESGPLKGE
jgi:Sel1 repeat